MARKKSFGSRIGNVLTTINSPTLRMGFSNIDKWVSSGNYAMNRLWSGSFDKALLFGRNYIFYGESGCHAKDTGILMYDGTIKMIQDIDLGDLVMGPDSSPRSVDGLFRGHNAKMYKITPANYDPFYVNDDHVLSLMHSGKVLNVTVKEYLAQDYSKQIYLYGNPIHIRHKDGGYITDIAYEFNRIANDMLSGSDEKIHIEQDVMDKMAAAPYNMRANFIKSLSSVKFKDGKEYSLFFKDESHVEFVMRVIRSMGMMAYRDPSKMTVRFKYSDTTLVPFTVEFSGIGEYFGLNVSGDHLYVMDNYLVTHNSGKSLFSAVAAANAQKDHDAFVVWIDVEHANDDTAGHQWLRKAGINTDDESFLYTSASTLEEIKMIISKICVDYMDQQKSGNDDLPPVVFVVDSWAAALTATQWERTGGKEAGRVVGDQGQKAKQLGDVIASVTHLCAGLPIMVIGIQHIMDNQDGYGRKHKTTGGNKILYYASGCILLTKKELRIGDVDSKELKEEYAQLEKTMLADVKKAAGGDKKMVGITATMEIIKSRVAKPFEKITIQIPYKTGIDKYSGLFELLMQEGLIRKGSPGWFEYGEGENVTKFRKADFKDHADTLMEMSNALEVSEEENDESI